MSKKINLKAAFDARRARVVQRAELRRDPVPVSDFRDKLRRQLPEGIGMCDQHVYLFLVSLQHGYSRGTVMLSKTPNDQLIRFDVAKEPYPQSHHPAFIALQEAWDAANACEQKKTFPRITISSDISGEGTTVRGAIHLFHDPAWLQWAFLGYDNRTVEDFVWTLDRPDTPWRNTGDALPLTPNDMADAMAAALGVPARFLLGDGTETGRHSRRRRPQYGIPPLFPVHKEFRNYTKKKEALLMKYCTKNVAVEHQLQTMTKVKTT